MYTRPQNAASQAIDVLDLFAAPSYAPVMADEPLHPATREDILGALSYALRFDERGKPYRAASEPMVAITAEVLTRYLERAGFVVMRRPPARPPRAG
jgi:hypothetical protein